MPFQWSMHNKNTQYPPRKSPRRSSIDYSTAGYYFVTICSYDREAFFGDVVNDQMRLNPAGQAMEDLWVDIPRQFNQVKLDAFVIMPNHIHGIIILEGGITLSRVVQAFKSIATHAYVQGVHQHGWKKFDQHLWQRSFYDHVVRNQEDLLRIQEYILNNPLQWAMDNENPDCLILRADTRSAPTKINRGTQILHFYA